MKTLSYSTLLVIALLFSGLSYGQIIDQNNWGNKQDYISCDNGKLGQTFRPSFSGYLTSVKLIMSAPRCYFDSSLTELTIAINIREGEGVDSVVIGGDTFKMPIPIGIHKREELVDKGIYLERGKTYTLTLQNTGDRYCEAGSKAYSPFYWHHSDSNKYERGLAIGAPVVNQFDFYFQTYMETSTSLNSKNANQELVIFPNPATNKLFVNIEQYGKEQYVNADYRIITSGGVVQKVGELTNYQNVIGIEELASGLYIIQVQNEKHTHSKPFMVL